MRGDEPDKPYTLADGRGPVPHMRGDEPTMSGGFVEMTPALAGHIFAAVAAGDQAIFAVAEQHRAAMLAGDDPIGYDYSTGWPQTFEEWEAGQEAADASGTETHAGE